MPSLVPDPQNPWVRQRIVVFPPRGEGGSSLDAETGI